MLGLQTASTHQSSNPMLAARLPSFTKIEKDAGGTEYAMAGAERCPNQAKQPGIFLGSLRKRFLELLIEATMGDFKYPA
jgi:hypothetical protein